MSKSNIRNVVEIYIASAISSIAGYYIFNSNIIIVILGFLVGACIGQTLLIWYNDRIRSNSKEN